MDKNIPIEAIRFKKVREELHFTQQSFAELLDVGTSTADIERGKTKPSGKVVMELLNQFGINPLWLFGKSHVQYMDVNGGDVSPKIITLSEEGNDNILLVNQKAAAGYPHNIQDVEWYQSLPTFNIPLPQYRNATYRGFQVEGDSMLPSIRPNDWVLGKAVSNIAEASDSRIYIVVMHDSVLVKKLQKITNNPYKVTLVSLNEDYLPIDIEIAHIQELWLVNSKLTFGLEEPANSGLLKQLHASMEELKGQIKSMQ